MIKITIWMGHNRHFRGTLCDKEDQSALSTAQPNHVPDMLEIEKMKKLEKIRQKYDKSGENEQHVVTHGII